MLRANGQAVAVEVLKESNFDPEQAVEKLVGLIARDRALTAEALQEAARSWVATAESRQRSHIHKVASSGRLDSAVGLALIAKMGIFDTYLLLNDVRLGDATHEDLQAFVDHHAATVRSSTARIRFARSILNSKKFAKGKRVRECFSEPDITRLAGESQ